MVFALVLALTLTAAVGYWQANRPPAWWPDASADAAGESADDRLDRARGIENAIANELTKRRPPGEPWPAAITEQQVNLWLAERARGWVEANVGAWPGRIQRVAVRFDADEIIVGADVRDAGAERPRIIAAGLRPTVNAAGDVTLDLTWVRLNALAIPASLGRDRLVEQLARALGRSPEELAGLERALRGKSLEGPFAFRLDDGRAVVLRRLAFGNGRLAVECTTEPPRDRRADRSR